MKMTYALNIVTLLKKFKKECNYFFFSVFTLPKYLFNERNNDRAMVLRLSHL